MVVGGVSSSSAQGQDSSVIHGCVKPGTGQLRIIDPDDSCKKNEKAIELVAATDGNVGIGIADPTEALDVSGNIHASGTIASGNSIVIDGDTESIVATSGTIDFVDGNLVTTGNIDGGGVAVNNDPVIDSSGQWVGDPTGLQGPQGPAGTLSGYEIREITATGNDVQMGHAAWCPEGKKAVGGGFWLLTPPAGKDFFVQRSAPGNLADGDGRGWVVGISNPSRHLMEFSVYAVCVDVTE
jgi:hypothetical protein